MLVQPTKYLLVEGKYDFHLIKNLLSRHNIIAEHHDKIKQTNHIAIVPMKGRDELQKNLELHLPMGAITELGIIIDADQNASSAYKSCYNFVSRYGEIIAPEGQGDSRNTLHLSRTAKPALKVGIWIMPDNQSTGFLEHFASELIPQTDKLWSLAKTTITALPEKRYPTTPRDHTRKAELHTWLAWQENPGKPMGLAVSFGYLKHDMPLALDFISWIRTVFTIDPNS